MGQTPLALDFSEFMTQRNIVGIFQKGENHYLLIFRNAEGSLKLAYYLTSIIGEKLRTVEIPQRISYDNKKPAILQGNKGKGRGKAQNGNKGRGKGNHPGGSAGGSTNAVDYLYSKKVEIQQVRCHFCQEENIEGTHKYVN